jgi:hypothetical protein
MKITKKQLKALIREQVAADINETDWRPTDSPRYHKPQREAGPYADEKDEDQDDQDADEKDEDQDDQDEENTTDLRGALKHDPMDRSARGKYRRGKMTGFKEGMKDVAALMSQAGAYGMHPDAMQRLMRVIKEFAPHLSDEELLDFAKDILKEPSDENPYAGGFLDSALGAPEEVGLEEESNRTAKGNVTQDARDDHATLSDGRFPIFDKKSALAALKLRGHGTTAAERTKIIDKAAKYAPEAAKKAREEDEKSEKKQ